jgi:predicted nicotinamide N-methyase
VTRDRDRLVARIHRQYQTVTERIPIGKTWLDFTRIADPDTVLDQIVDEEDRREKSTGVRLEPPPHLPYWAELWESSRALPTVLSKMDFSNRPHILDLGCGMGLAGASAAAMGANVTLVDLESSALLFARLNTLPFGSHVRQINWQTDDLNERYDLILGADIVYEKAQWPFLLEFWTRHLAPGGALLLAEPGRQSGDKFVEWIQDRNWRVVQTTTVGKVRIFTIKNL